MSTSEDTLVEMGRAGRILVRERLNWDSIAQQACSLYASLLSGGQKSKNKVI
jgi:hypothetical protein